jgi:glycosidase
MKRLFWAFATLLLFAGCKDEIPPWVPPTPPKPDFEGVPVVARADEWDGTKRGNVSYQLLIYSFADGPDADKTGDLAGLISRLPYLDELGVSAVWLSPVHPSSSYHGYDVLDYEAVNPAFGDDAALKSFIDAAHARGIKVYLDWVLNHTSVSHPWFIDAKSSANSPYRDYYILSPDPAKDIADGKIDQIATEGAAGFEQTQWYSTGSNSGMKGRLKFTLDWSGAAPVATVEETTAPADAENTTAATGDRYLYFGNGVNRRFYNRGGGLYDLVVEFDSDWGFLIRTTTVSWNRGEKFGAPDNQTIIRLGVPFTLDSATAADIRFAVSDQYHSHFWTGAFADLNYGKAAAAENSPAFRSITAAADKWVAMGVDGFRLDAVKHIYHNGYSDENPTFLRKFYDRMSTSWSGQGNFYMVGEMYDGYNRVAPYYAGLPALFEFDFWNRLKWALQNDTGRYFAKDVSAMRTAYAAVRPDYIAATKLSNHDEVRAASEIGGSEAKIKLAGAVLMTASGQPYVYQGEELGYRGTKEGGDEWVRTPIMWDAAGNDLATGALGGKIDNAMLTAAISVENQSKTSGSVLDVYRTFSALRNTYPALAVGDMTPHATYNDANAEFGSIAAWYRTSGGQRMLVLHNFGSRPQLLTLKDDKLGKAVGVLGEVLLDAGTSRLQMGAYSSVVFMLNN